MSGGSISEQESGFGSMSGGSSGSSGSSMSGGASGSGSGSVVQISPQHVHLKLRISKFLIDQKLHKVILSEPNF